MGADPPRPRRAPARVRERRQPLCAAAAGTESELGLPAARERHGAEADHRDRALEGPDRQGHDCRRGAKAPGLLHERQGRRQGVPHLHRLRRPGGRGKRGRSAARPPHGRHRAHARAAQAHSPPRGGRRDRGGRGRRRARVECGTRPGSPPDRRRGADRRDGRPERARRRHRRPGRALAARKCVQHDARCARGVTRDAAAFRRRRVARAANAADKPADEHRRPEAAGAPRPGSAHRVSSRTSSARPTRCAS